MTRKELIQAIKKCKLAYGAVQLIGGDVEYIQLVKKDLLYRISMYSEYDMEFNATLTNSNFLFIN